jgi:hypothetical protein
MRPGIRKDSPPLSPSLDKVPVRVEDQEKPCLGVIRYLSLRLLAYRVGTKQSKLFAHQQRERVTNT